MMATNPKESVMLKNLWTRLRGHFQEYISRYSVLALAVLTPAAGLLGELAADLGGVNTGAGRVVLAAASALGTAAAGVVFIRNLGIWQMLDTFGKAPGVAAPVAVEPAPVSTPVQVRVDGKSVAEAVSRSIAERGLATGGVVDPVPTGYDIPPDEDNSGLEETDGDAALYPPEPASEHDDPALTGAPDLVTESEDDES